MPGLLGLAAKKSSVFERRKGFTGGVHTVLCSLGASKLLGCAEESKGFNRCSGCVFGLTVGGQLHCPLISQADSACSSITGASSFKILFSSSRLVTRIKESCSMKSILVSNQQCVMKVNWGRGRCKSCLHSQREFDFFEDSQQNSYC